MGARDTEDVEVFAGNGAPGAPPGYRLLKRSGDGIGNFLLLVDEGGDARVLKLYRERTAAAFRLFSAFSHRFLERKRGIGARARFETERLTMDLWQRHGFDVFRRLELPIPPAFEPPAAWFEYCPGVTLAAVLKNRAVAIEEKRSIARRLAAATAPRHQLALELGEPLLAHEHASTKHVLIHGERLVTFDFEGAFLASVPAIEALAQELAQYARSLAKYGGEGADELLRAFAEGYGDTALLEELAAWGVHGGGLYRRIRRWHDRFRRADNDDDGPHGRRGGPKTDALERLRALVR
jgi:hypothetical protein